MAENVRTYLRGTQKVAWVSKLSANNPVVICRGKNSSVLTAAWLARLSQESAGLLSRRSRVQAPAGLTLRVLWFSWDVKEPRESSLLSQRDQRSCAVVFSRRSRWKIGKKSALIQISLAALATRLPRTLQPRQLRGLLSVERTLKPHGPNILA